MTNCANRKALHRTHNLDEVLETKVACCNNDMFCRALYTVTDARHLIHVVLVAVQES